MLPRLLALATTAFTLFALYWAARTGYADYLALDYSPATTAAAIRLTPANADYYAQLAESNPPNLQAVMQQALALNPFDSNLYLQFAQLAEKRHDPALARTYLLRAVQLDRTFAPRWRLAEFYGRANDQPHFWPAIRAALATSYDDVSPLFDLCWQMTGDPATILPRAIPSRIDVNLQYLDYLLAKHRTALAAPVAQRLLQYPAPQLTPSLLAYSDQSLAAGDIAPALRVWNTLSRSRLIDYPVLNPSLGNAVTNPDFTYPFLSQAFDWRIVKPPQIFADHQDWVRFDFSGKQPEQCGLIEQYVPLLPSRAYKLDIRYYTRRLSSDLHADTGLRWQLTANSTAIPLQPDISLPESESTRIQQYAFTTSAQTNLAKLQLAYQRALGTVRIEGALYLQSVHLDFAP